MCGTRSTLCAVLDALQEHASAFTIIGAHAVYEHSKRLPVYSTATSDADMAANPALLVENIKETSKTPEPVQPIIAAALQDLGYRPLAELARGLPEGHRGRRWQGRPGLWGRGIDEAGDPVEEFDLMVPSALAGGGRRSVRSLKGHGKETFGRVPGIEMALYARQEASIDNYVDGSSRRAMVAAPSALLCAKAYKITDRLDSDRKGRQIALPKDALDVWRVMAASDPSRARAEFGELSSGGSPVAGPTQEGLARTRRILAEPQVWVLAEQAAAGSLEETDVREVFTTWRQVFS